MCSLEGEGEGDWLASEGQCMEDLPLLEEGQEKGRCVCVSVMCVCVCVSVMCVCLSII